MTVFHAGSCEPLKGSVHAALGLLALVCVSYNLLAWTCRRETHLAVNVGIYSAIVWLEHRAVQHHQRTKLVETTTISRAVEQSRYPRDRISAESATRSRERIA